MAYEGASSPGPRALTKGSRRASFFPAAGHVKVANDAAHRRDRPAALEHPVRPPPSNRSVPSARSASRSRSCRRFRRRSHRPWSSRALSRRISRVISSTRARERSWSRPTLRMDSVAQSMPEPPHPRFCPPGNRARICAKFRIGVDLQRTPVAFDPAIRRFDPSRPSQVERPTGRAGYRPRDNVAGTSDVSGACDGKIPEVQTNRALCLDRPPRDGSQIVAN